jgi:hypothetical protein
MFGINLQLQNDMGEFAIKKTGHGGVCFGGFVGDFYFIVAKNLVFNLVLERQNSVPFWVC